MIELAIVSWLIFTSALTWRVLNDLEYDLTRLRK